jgi:GR25 family glycosyltransferase involved in LPS biosynthesis
MTMRLNDFFPKVFCINLDRRTDRWEQCLAEAAKFGVELERFPGSVVHIDGKLHGNAGCTLSHRRLLKHIAEGPWDKVLILEDDFQVFIRPPKWDEYLKGFDVTREQFEEAFGITIAHLPADWDSLHLCAHYGSKPLARINKHIIQANTILTTSSYGVTRQFARILSDYMEAGARSINSLTPETVYLGPIDSVMSEVYPKYRCYVCQPRLMVQRASHSDITERDENYLGALMDLTHQELV